MAVFALDSHGTPIGDDSVLRVRLLSLTSFFKFDFLDLGADDLLNKLMSGLTIKLVVISAALVRNDDIRLLGAGRVLQSIAAGEALSALDHVVLGSGVLHLDQPTSGGELIRIIVARSTIFVEVLILEGLKKILRCLFRAANLFHLLPNLFNVEVHDVFLMLGA
jgi:hypothetical protein